MSETATTQGAGRRSGLRQKGYYWDVATLNQRRRTRLQKLERENYVAIPEFDNMTISVGNLNDHKKVGRPRSNLSTPRPSASVVVIGTGDEGLKRVNRKETRRLMAQKQTFADVLAKETDNAASNYQNTNGSNTTVFNYLTCITAPTQGSQKIPDRHFCSVCGYRGLYTCVDCGMRYCSLACKSTHTDTRCLKHVT